MIDLFSANVAYASVDSFLANVGEQIINPLIVLLFALATAFFLFGIFQFVTNAENEEKRTEGRNHILWGVIGLTIMIGVWTILNVILNTFNIKNIDPEKGTVQLNDYTPTLK